MDLHNVKSELRPLLFGFARIWPHLKHIFYMPLVCGFEVEKAAFTFDQKCSKSNFPSLGIEIPKSVYVRISQHRI